MNANFAARNRRTFLLGVLVAGTASFAASAPAMSADPKHGAELYQRCSRCHSLEANPAEPPPGPSLAGIFGRQAGTFASYTRFSQVMKNSGIVWNDDSMDRFLASSDAAIPGNRMIDVEITDKGDRADLIAYLKQATVGH